MTTHQPLAAGLAVGAEETGRRPLSARLAAALFTQVDASALVFLRIAFGFIMLVEVWRFFEHGWIDRHYIAPDFYFTYFGFDWVAPWPGDGMYWHFVGIAVLSFMIMVGLFYRLATILFFVAFLYIFLLDQSRYLNHFYLVILVAFLLMIVPAHRSYSLDAWIRRRSQDATIPSWTIWIFRLQFEVVYLYAGLVKMNADWLRLEPLGMWLARRDHHLLGPLYNEDWVVALAAYGSILLHLIGAPLLMFKRTRGPVMVVYFAFHLSNHFLFRIGIFPWMTMAATLMFLDPDWPKQLYRWLAHRVWPTIALPAWGGSADWRPAPVPSRLGLGGRLLAAFIGLWLALQVLVPLRHYLYPGDVAWNEEGHRFSWRMKLRDKRSEALFIVRDPATGETWEVRPEDYLLEHQARPVSSRPDMILQFAHHLAEVWAEEEGIAPVEVRADVCSSLNGRWPARLIDPTRDLTKIERDMGHADWVLPLDKPFERPLRRAGRQDLRC